MTNLTLIRDTIITPTLNVLGLDSDPAHRLAAVHLLLGTGLAESAFRTIEQVGGGPALGYWQVESATYYDTWENYLTYRPRLAAAVLTLTGGTAEADRPPADAMRTNHRLCCTMARLKYRRSPRPLPEPDDFVAMGRLWVEIYNAGGKATLERWRAEVIPVLKTALAAVPVA